MHTAALVLACLACTPYASRIRKARNRTADLLLEDHHEVKSNCQPGSTNSLTLAASLRTSRPSAGWQVLGPTQSSHVSDASSSFDGSQAHRDFTLEGQGLDKFTLLRQRNTRFKATRLSHNVPTMEMGGPTLAELQQAVSRIKDLESALENSQLFYEAHRMLEAQESLAKIIAAARAKADLGAQQSRESAIVTVDYMGAQDAPPDVRKRIEGSSCGSKPFPHDAQVDDLWASMRTATSDNGAVCFGAWSPWRLRGVGAEVVESFGIKSVNNDEAAFVAEALERWSAFSKSLANIDFTSTTPTAHPVLQEDASGHRIEAYVTHLTDDDYVLGACMLAASLAATRTTRPLLAMITDGVSAAGRKSLHAAGWALLDVRLVGSEEDPVQIRGYFSKMYLWGLPCHSVIYIDTDVVVLENLDHLFTSAKGYELAAVPDSLPHVDGRMEVQAGFMVIEPSLTRFADLWEVCFGSRRPDEGLDFWKHHEQGFLALYYDGDRGIEACGPGDHRPKWRILPAKYNHNIRYALRPLYDGLTPGNTAIAHFACCKPWDLTQRDYAPPIYIKLFLELARDIGVPWRPGNCAMDAARKEHQRQKFTEFMIENGHLDGLWPTAVEP